MLLLVEDDVMPASAMRRMLRSVGHEVLIARSVAESRMLLASALFDVVLCDIHLGDGTAADVVDAVEALRASLPVLLMTGLITEDAEAIAAAHPCVSGLVAKSIPPPELRELVRRALLQRPPLE